MPTSAIRKQWTFTSDELEKLFGVEKTITPWFDTGIPSLKYALSFKTFFKNRQHKLGVKLEFEPNLKVEVDGHVFDYDAAYPFENQEASFVYRNGGIGSFSSVTLLVEVNLKTQDLPTPNPCLLTSEPLQTLASCMWLKDDKDFAFAVGDEEIKVSLCFETVFNYSIDILG